MLEFLKHLGAKFLKFIVDLWCKLTLLATLFSVTLCLILFFMFLFVEKPFHALLSLAGMMCFIYANKQF